LEDALGFDVPVDELDDRTMLHDPRGRSFTKRLQQLPEGKIVNNRLHFDPMPESGGLEEDFERLQRLGAVPIKYVGIDDGESHWVMADPEGNEFRILGPDRV